MAINFTKIKHQIRQDPDAKIEFKTAGLSKQQWYNLFNGLDEWWDTNQIAVKTVVEGKAGVSVTNALAKKISKFWMMQKVGEL